MEEYNVKTFAKNFFEAFLPFPAITNGVKWKLPFWQHFLSSACIFGRKMIRPKIFFVRSTNILKFFQKHFWQCGIRIEQYKRGPWGGGNPCSPPFFPNPDFICFCAKRKVFHFQIFHFYITFQLEKMKKKFKKNSKKSNFLFFFLIFRKI